MKNLILTAKITAASSFLIGTILCALYVYFDNPSPLEIIGLYFVIIAFWVNIFLLILLLICLIIETEFRIKILRTCGLMLLNLPIAFGYLLLVINSLNF